MPQVNVNLLKYRLAKIDDAEAVIALVNSVYRGDSAKDLWTTESELVDGPRIDGKAYKEIINKKGSHLILALAVEEIIACVHLQESEEDCHLGMLSVRGDCQMFGLGKILLTYGENYAVKKLGAEVMSMHVITVRAELLDWYQRRGYQVTGERVPFGNNDGLNRPKKGPLFFETLKKKLI